MITNIATLPTLDDDTLWRVSRSQPTVEDGVLLDALVDKRRRQGLTAGEERLLAELIDRHDRVMALRAEAVALLHARNRRARSGRPRMSSARIGRWLRAQVLADAACFRGKTSSSV